MIIRIVMKVFLVLLAGIVGAVVMRMAGFIVGFSIAGNYAVDFVYRSSIGYGAGGSLGAEVGSVAGAILGPLGLLFFWKKKTSVRSSCRL